MVQWQKLSHSPVQKRCIGRAERLLRVQSNQQRDDNLDVFDFVFGLSLVCMYIGKNDTDTENVKRYDLHTHCVHRCCHLQVCCLRTHSLSRSFTLGLYIYSFIFWTKKKNAKNKMQEPRVESAYTNEGNFCSLKDVKYHLKVTVDRPFMGNCYGHSTVHVAYVRRWNWRDFGCVFSR